MNIPADVSYSLDCMFELNELTIASSIMATMFNSNNVVAIHDNSTYETMKYNFNDLFIEWFHSSATLHEKQYLAICMINGSYIQLSHMVDIVQHMIYYEKDDPFWYVDTFISHINLLLPYYLTRVPIDVFKPLIELKNQKSINHIADTIDRKINIKHKKLKDTKTRKALLKGLSLFENLFGSKLVKTFISGNSFTIDGYHYNYKITKTKSLLKYTEVVNSPIIPYSLEIVDKKTQLVLCNICTVVSDSPVVDQIISILLLIKSGNEEDFLNECNIINTTPEFNVNTHYLNNDINNKPDIGLLSDMIFIDPIHTDFQIWQKNNNKQIHKLVMDRLKSNMTDFKLLDIIKENRIDVILDKAFITRDQVICIN